MTSWLSARSCKFLYVDRLCKVRLCATEELALCLDLILGRRIWHAAHRSLVLNRIGSMALCTGSDECKKIED
jgi:hypothetical protein